jgi:NAD(P)-dependent dehydrogenase (short-subunit alcohol dehydrogenase family)
MLLAAQPQERKDTMGLLDGKVAIVTGAGRGIGREEALLLAAEGAKVIVNDYAGPLTDTAAGEHPAQDTVDQIKENGGQAAVNGDDISSWEGGKNVVTQAIDTFGSLDILVNNAGILRDKMSFNMEESDWDDVIRVHLKGHFAPTHHAAVYWRNRAKAGEEVTGRIINTSSEAGLYGNAGQANYGAAKAGIAALTWILARELGRYGITSNAIAPRARTRMTENLFGEMTKKDDGAFDAWDPKNIANLVVFLAAPESADINGQIFVVFGGNIYAMSAFKPVGQVTRDAAWTPQELIEAKGQLFDGIDSGVPKFSFF